MVEHEPLTEGSGSSAEIARLISKEIGCANQLCDRDDQLGNRKRRFLADLARWTTLAELRDGGA